VTDTARAEFTNALRQLADWLDANPQYPHPTRERVLLPLHTNAAVREFADRFGLGVSADAEGNLSAEIKFGPVAYHVYGYVDFAAHCAADEERRARRWAEKSGMEFVAKAADSCLCPDNADLHQYGCPQFNG
jgi:hypothetical protein